MSNLYPLLLVPEFHERPWGTRDLKPIYTRVVGKNPIGEAWLTGDSCKIANGPLAGRTLVELCAEHGESLVGTAAPHKDRFPLLAKFLFPREKLSVQVHPDDEAARKVGQPCGKTECWYVVRAMKDAQVGLGLTPGTTLESFERAIQEKTAEQHLNWINVEAGDLIYVDAGTVHAIGPGSILIEAQQNSDTTYRLYDYGRPRELHVEQGLAATKLSTYAGKIAPQRLKDRDVLVASPCFIVERIHCSESMTIAPDSEGSSAEVLVASAGSGVVECEGSQPVVFNQGEAVVIPAEIKQFNISPQWSLEFLRMRVPGKKLPQPYTFVPTSSVATLEGQ